MFAAPVNRLITELARLPGIGQRTAQRLAFHSDATEVSGAASVAVSADGQGAYVA